jgi:hypothetical protein
MEFALEVDRLAQRAEIDGKRAIAGRLRDQPMRSVASLRSAGSTAVILASASAEGN